MGHNLHFNLGDSLLFDSFIQEHIYFICGPTIAVWPLARFGPGPQKHIKPKGHNNWTFIRLEEIWKILIKREIRTWRRSAALRNFLLEFSLKTKVPHGRIYVGESFCRGGTEDNGESFMLISSDKRHKFYLFSFQFDYELNIIF